MALLRLATLVHDPAVAVSQRQMAICLITSAPRWLWPEPVRPPSDRLPPQARPHIARERCAMVMQNRWDDIGALLFDAASPSALPDSPPAPIRPGLVAGPIAHRISESARHGRFSAACKQLFSFGFASPTRLTEENLRAKWRPPDDSFLLEGRFLQPAESTIFLDSPHVRLASRSLKRETAPDALGWTTEAWTALVAREDVLPVLREILVQYTTGHCGSIAQDLVNLSRMTPLYKDATGNSIHPIAIPMVWRKLVGRAAVNHFRDVLQHAAGPFQFAAMTPDGSARMAASTRWRASSDPETVFIRTDIQNAFNEVHRHSVCECLSRASPPSRRNTVFVAEPSIYCSP